MQKKNDNYTQLSIFDILAGNSDLSSEDLDDVISMLQKQRQRIRHDEEEVKKAQLRREEKQREEEANRIKMLREAAERKRREEEEKAAEAHIQEVISMDLPMDWENIYDSDDSTIGVKVETIPDGLVKCLNVKGYVDIEYIASITDADYKTVINTLKGAIYQNPETWGECFYKGWEVADQYLSGNIRTKYQAAKEANEIYHGYFDANVKALEKVFPPSVSCGDIYITLGSPWVPTSVIEDFIYYVTQTPKYNQGYRFSGGTAVYRVLHDEITGTWVFDWDYKYHQSYNFRETYGTKRRTPFEILLKTLNLQSVAVTDTVKSAYTKSGKQSVINKEETVLALEKQKLLIETFQKWVWSDKNRKEMLVKIYEEKYCSVRKRYYDGSFLEFPGMDENTTLFHYQKNAVARILFSPNTLLAHDVGSGKTYIMIAAGMELRRLKLLGKEEKLLYVVPNNLIGQWRSIFLTMYPGANLLTIEPKQFTPTKREEMLEEIRDGNYDATIIAYSCFSQISISKRYCRDVLNEELKQCQSVPVNATSKKLSNKIEKLEAEISELIFEADEAGIYFDELGFTRLFVDEAHNFKNVPIETKIENVMGISKAGSIKCKDMLDKVRIVQRESDGGGVVFATGTPITNSITDAYIMQQYLQAAELSILELNNFDSWVGMFAEKTTNFEIDVDTSNYRMATRFAKFHNIPELTTLLASVADFHEMDESAGIPNHDGYKDELVRKTKEFTGYLEEISERADDVRNGRVSRTDDNMLKITTDGRKAALDLRLVGIQGSYITSTKVFKCAENVSNIYKTTLQNKSTQLVFCDTSTPKGGFNIYDELKLLLTKMGVKTDEIAYIHDASTEAQREKLFTAVQKGDIRVLIGSTFKLGLGVNVQDKLIAVHHLDVPWRPADMVQREGRILRQGNENEEVEIYRYITEGSFDAYSWQLLETKQRFITDILSGTVAERSGADVDDTVLDYAEVKALAVGNPLIKKRVEVANELSKYRILQQKEIMKRTTYEKDLAELPEKIERIKALIPTTKADAEFYVKNKQEYNEDERRDIRQKVYAASHTEEPTTEEVVAVEYQGFNIIVPAHVSKIHPIIYLRREGQYMVELGSSEIGDMTRINNCLEGLEKRVTDLQTRLSEHVAKKAFMESELLKEQNYADKIREIQEELEEIDKRLKVEQR